MRRKVLCCVLLLVFMMTGCFDQISVEDVSLSLMLGIDLDDNNNLLMYMSSPVFNKEAKQKEETTGVKSVTVRKSRERFDTTGYGANIGKQNASHLSWEAAIETKLESDFKHLIKKIQAAEIDPFGLGTYARTYTYPEWKKVQNQWGKVLAKGDVNIKVSVKIAGMGTIK